MKSKVTRRVLSSDSSSNSYDRQLKEGLSKIAPKNYENPLDYFKQPYSEDYARYPQDPQNPITREKVELGKLLFHETGIGTLAQDSERKNTYSCASCHVASSGFTSPSIQGIAEGGEGSGVTRAPSSSLDEELIDASLIKTPSLLNIGFQENVLWNGQFGSGGRNKGTENLWSTDDGTHHNRKGFQGLETQAFAGMATHRLLGDEGPREKSEFDRSIIKTNREYQELFNKAFPQESEKVTMKTIAFAIAAYERSLIPNKAPFQRWLKGERGAMTNEQKRGALLFFGKAKCFTCHTGPALNSMNFYAIGMEDFKKGSEILVNKENSNRHLGRFSFTKKEEDRYKFKVPQLYNLKDHSAYGTGASFKSLREVILYKNTAIAQNPEVTRIDLSPLGLNISEIDALETFLRDALYDPDLQRYFPKKIPSGLCFPNNDELTRRQNNC